MAGRGFSESVNMHSAAAATGNGSILPVDGAAAVGIQVKGASFVGTITFEATVDGTNWVALPCTNISNGAASSTTTADGVFVASVGGLRSVRARVSAYTSGTVSVGGMAVTSGQGPFSSLTLTRKTLTFDGGSGTGEAGAVPLFTVTGEVLVALLCSYCSVNVASAGAPTLLLGVTGDTDLFIASTTALDIDAGDFWVSDTPTANGMAVPAALKDIAITDNIIATVGVADITGGTIRFDLYWMALSPSSNVAVV